MNVPDEMAEAALATYYPGLVGIDTSELDRVRAALAAALAAAPTVGGWVWCEDHNAPGGGSAPGTCFVRNCPGPHRTLILGPEVTP